jgi:hypothetical protein
MKFRKKINNFMILFSLFIMYSENYLKILNYYNKNKLIKILNRTNRKIINENIIMYFIINLI